MAAKFFSAILIYSKNVERSAKFYRDVVGIPLEEEQHGNSALHYGCELGDIHFAIHGAKNDVGVGSINLAFEVFDIEKHIADMKANGAKLTAEIQDRGFMKIATVQDPDGNTIEFTQLSDRWMTQMKERRDQGHNMVSEWETRKK
jgi:predicted enzyme related to lactoylglutathione lyase